ncbi:MAG TPA: hypothetical protein PKD90_11540, partial [Phnomibacter sp.]|nr:hypothetical protein [Phnomibacter sp.]
CQVIEQYGCTMVTKYDDVRQEAQEPELLNITTHYEKLDIAQSGKIFYVCFKLPGVLADKGQDELLKKWVFEHEATGNSYCNSQEYDRTEEP